MVECCKYTYFKYTLSSIQDGGFDMEEPYCAQCVHYIPHYIKFGENLYDLIRCGHCIFPRKKHRDAYAKPCNHFQKVPKKRDRSEPENPVE